DPEPPAEPWAALLPALDPTTMGWKDRDFYLDQDFAPAVFDWAGNAGTTAWWDGQIVGAYVQHDGGQVELIVPRDPGLAGRAALQAEAKRLGDWLDGEKVPALYKSPLITWDRLQYCAAGWWPSEVGGSQAGRNRRADQISSMATCRTGWTPFA